MLAGDGRTDTVSAAKLTLGPAPLLLASGTFASVWDGATAASPSAAVVLASAVAAASSPAALLELEPMAGVGAVLGARAMLAEGVMWAGAMLWFFVRVRCGRRSRVSMR